MKQIHGKRKILNAITAFSVIPLVIERLKGFATPMTLSCGISPDYPAGKHFPDPGHRVYLFVLTEMMRRCDEI